MNPFAPLRRPLPTVNGTSEIVSEGVRALEALPGLLDYLSNDEAEASVGEIEIWENAPITAKIEMDMIWEDYGWTGSRWVRIEY